MRALAALVILCLAAFVPAPASASEPSVCSVGPYPGSTILRAGCDFACVEGQTIVALGVGATIVGGPVQDGAGVLLAHCGAAAASCVAFANAGGDACADHMSPTLGRGDGTCEGIGAGFDRFACCALPASADPVALCKALVGW